MKAPLYMMSAGDLGCDPAHVEDSLSNILEMNTKWQSVLLLDEADVFLESRSAHDLERNKLVSIFLRLLEYYEGVLFLTTNRVENIDAAFESRIHLSLQYDELDKPSRKHVWETFLSRASSSGVGGSKENSLETFKQNGIEALQEDASGFTSYEIDKLAERPMNGRQIKNVLKTSQLLASKQGVKLAFGHVDTVLRLRERNARKRGVEEIS
jgi:chromatin segregation and condensation protein Rec8/ScpA/Scc1 (kleisin family)